MSLIFFAASYTLTASLGSGRVQPVGSITQQDKSQAQAIVQELHTLIGKLGPRHWKIRAAILPGKLTIQLEEHHTLKHLAMRLLQLPTTLLKAGFKPALAIRLSTLGDPQKLMDAACEKTQKQRSGIDIPL